MCIHQEHKEPGFVCPKTGRVAVRISDFAASDLNGDSSAYLFSQEADDMGLDPWRAIEGVDAHLKGEAFDIWFADRGFKTAGPQSSVFVSAADARRLAECI